LYFLEVAKRLAIKYDKFKAMKSKILFKNTFLFFFVIIFTSISFVASAQSIQTGAEQTDLYLPLLKDKKVGILTNQTWIVNFYLKFKYEKIHPHDLKTSKITYKQMHSVDFLIQTKMNLKKIYAPEHGFRGTADAGELIKDGKDTTTGLPIISLYGNNKKPTKEQ